MDLQQAQAPLLCTTWPVFATELAAALDAGGESGLKEQIERLRIVERCSCDDDFCQSFSTAGAARTVRRRPRNVCLDAPWSGYLILDVVDDEIVYVEVLYRSPLC